MTEEREFRRVIWKCRRGSKELDLILGKFARESFGGLAPGEKSSFEELLDLEDPILTDWLCYQVRPHVQGLENIVRKILSTDQH